MAPRHHAEVLGAHVLRELGRWSAPVTGLMSVTDGALTQDQEADQDQDQEEERTITLVRVLEAMRSSRIPPIMAGGSGSAASGF